LLLPWVRVRSGGRKYLRCISATLRAVAKLATVERRGDVWRKRRAVARRERFALPRPSDHPTVRPAAWPIADMAVSFADPILLDSCRMRLMIIQFWKRLEISKTFRVLTNIPSANGRARLRARELFCLRFDRPRLASADKLLAEGNKTFSESVPISAIERHDFMPKILDQAGQVLWRLNETSVRS
jgi:hypothetical protein